MPKVIEAIYENGVFKPLEKVDIEEHKRIKIILPSKIEYIPSEECTLEGIIELQRIVLTPTFLLIMINTSMEKFQGEGFC